MVHIAHQHTSSHIERILQHVVRHLLAVHIERVVLTPYMCGCRYMVVEGHQYSHAGLTTSNEVRGDTEAYKVLLIHMSLVCPHNALIDVPQFKLTVCGPASVGQLMYFGCAVPRCGWDTYADTNS